MTYRQFLRGSLKPLVVVAAAIYFFIDAVILAILRPVSKLIANLGFFRVVAAWIESLGPYPTLAMFLVPLVLLEPIKPVCAYLIASGHFRQGVLLLALGEVLKMTIVERIFHIGRPKLMTIAAFAWTYNYLLGWLHWLQSLPPWQAVKRRFADFVHWTRKLRRPRQRRNPTDRPPVQAL